MRHLKLNLVPTIVWAVFVTWNTFCGLLTGVGAVATAQGEDNPNNIQLPVLTWLLQQEGRANFDSTKQRIALEHDYADGDKDDTKSRWSIYAATYIPSGSVLATIPWTAMIGPPPDSEDSSPAHFHCGTARAVWKELELGDASKFAPYLDHLRKNQPLQNQLPSQYSPAGKALFLEVLGGHDSPMLLMERAVDYDSWDWKILCGTGKQSEEQDSDDDDVADDDEIEDIAASSSYSSSSTIITEANGVQAAMWVQQHAFADRMIPLKDLYTHRNGHYHNVDIVMVPGKYAQIVSLRRILEGEQLHLSYNQCQNCLGDEDKIYGTPEIFRDHGIIESMPQIWVIPESLMVVPYENENGEEVEAVFSGMDIIFRLSESESNDNVEKREEKMASTIQVEFIFEEFEPSVFSYIDALFRFRIQELLRLKNIVYPGQAEDYNMIPHEWDAIWAFHEAYSMALKRAVVHLHHLIVQEQQQKGNHTSSSSISRRTCRELDNWDDHYTDFQVELDHLAYNQPDCESSELIDFFSYIEIERERSNYQEMLWQYREEDDDTCLHLDGMLQICSSYRPHYHEFFIHYPARYMESVKRVIFLGSGDAMLLHEILKYPNLEKVVGLELDQTVTRKSFRHFKTQPHYDDPRVEWWYGDATKTLPLLPQDYWGSFDLLLVDLSETVVSLHVTGKHDVLDVISMLLKPEGVMLENELYIDKMSRHFDHTVHIFYGSPKVCVQVHTVSSNDIDFLKSPIYDHKVDTFLIDPVIGPTDRFRYIHDFVKTNAIDEGDCDQDDLDLVTTEYGRKAGILMVLEAEQCSKSFKDINVEELIRQVLQDEGLSPLSSTVESHDVTTISVVMKEGYVVARVWPTLHYVGLDLHFWGAFSKMEGLRAALVEALGSQTSSSYRVVVGGMHGSSTLTQDEEEIGVRFSPRRNCTASDLSSKELIVDDAITIALDESLDLLANPKKLVVGVVCGPQQDERKCWALQVLKRHPRVESVIDFYTCKGIPDYNNGTDDFQSMYDCEKQMITRLEFLHKQRDLSIDAFVIDLTAPLSMLQIFASIWAVPDHRDDWLEQPYVVALPYMHRDPKRNRFMDLFRKFGHGAVTTMADLNFKGSNARDALGWRVFTFNDLTAVHSISEMERKLQERLPHTKIMLDLLEGGHLHTPFDLQLEERSFLPEAYDYGPNKKQMEEQRPLGRQTIFQLEKTSANEASMPSMVDLVSALTSTLSHMGYETSGREVEQWSNVGDGSVVTVAFAQGNLVMVWDGLEHVDINLFCFNESSALADEFLNHFVTSVDHRLERSLRDDQPRGIGRVVNFLSDIVRDKDVDNAASVATTATVTATE